jgi:hypothetical protein
MAEPIRIRLRTARHQRLTRPGHHTPKASAAARPCTPASHQDIPQKSQRAGNHARANPKITLTWTPQPETITLTYQWIEA